MAHPQLSAGFFYGPRNRLAYVAPVATDPDYRRLGRAAVLESIRRARERGATAAFVGPEQEFYLSFGFEDVHPNNYWLKFPGS